MDHILIKITLFLMLKNISKLYHHGFNENGSHVHASRIYADARAAVLSSARRPDPMHVQCADFQSVGNICIGAGRHINGIRFALSKCSRRFNIRVIDLFFLDILPDGVPEKLVGAPQR